MVSIVKASKGRWRCGEVRVYLRLKSKLEKLVRSDDVHKGGECAFVTWQRVLQRDLHGSLTSFYVLKNVSKFFLYRLD
jgi:hypothetical protein